MRITPQGETKSSGHDCRGHDAEAYVTVSSLPPSAREPVEGQGEGVNLAQA